MPFFFFSRTLKLHIILSDEVIVGVFQEGYYIMRLLPVRNCKPGMKLARRIFSEEGVVLLGENVELTTRLIQRLDQCGIQYVYIFDPRTEDITPPEIISEDTTRMALQEIRVNFRKMVDRPNVKKGTTFPYIAGPIRNMMNSIIDDLSSHKDAMIMLMNMGFVDHYLYQHSLNVCVYTTLLGMAHGYSREELVTLGMGALLHDIGKVKIPIKVLQKDGPLTPAEYDEIKKHTVYGFEMLKDEPNMPLIVAHCAFQHHERLNGTGYPRGIQSCDIHEYAKWIGLVDSYDAMTTNRVYSQPMLPHMAMEQLYTGSDTLYEKYMLEQFRDRVAIYPIGISVRLHSGHYGVVVDLNSAYPHRPIVRLLYDEMGQEIAAPYEIDLSKNLTAIIVSVGVDLNSLTPN